MKALVILVVLVTLAIIIYKYTKDKDLKKLLIALSTFGMIISLAIMGNLTRPIIPIFIAHTILIIGAWGAGVLYLFKEKYYWWVILSPLLTIGLFLLLELLTGSGHELI
jgi:hypothetical protein